MEYHKISERSGGFYQRFYRTAPELGISSLQAFRFLNRWWTWMFSNTVQ